MNIQIGDRVFVNWGGAYGNERMAEQIGLDVSKLSNANNKYLRYGSGIDRHESYKVVKMGTLPGYNLLLGIEDDEGNQYLVTGKSERYAELASKRILFELPDDLFQIEV